MTDTLAVPGGRWRLAALVVLCGAFILFLAIGTRATMGLFVVDISASLGWGREVFALAIAVQNLVWGLAQPFTGAIADRYGAARTLAVAGLVYAAGMYLMQASTSPLEMTLTAGFLVGVAVAASSFSVVLSAVARVVPPERRSLAFGICTGIASAGQLVLLPVGQAFIDAYGWQVAVLLLGALTLLIVPLAVPLAGRSVGAESGSAASWTAALGEAFRHRGYWLLTGGYFVCGFHVTFIGLHLPPYLLDAGLTRENGAFALGIVGLFNILGSVLAGYLGGRYHKPYLLAAIYFGRAVVICGYILLPLSVASTYVFAALMGLLWLSTVPVTTAVVGQIFGVRYLGMLAGIVFFSHQIGAFLGAWLGGLLYDQTGSYAVVWWLSVALGLAAALINLPIDDRALRRAPAAT